jgi:hypothetical protein
MQKAKRIGNFYLFRTKGKSSPWLCNSILGKKTLEPICFALSKNFEKTIEHI